MYFLLNMGIFQPAIQQLPCFFWELPAFQPIILGPSMLVFGGVVVPEGNISLSMDCISLGNLWAYCIRGKMVAAEQSEVPIGYRVLFTYPSLVFGVIQGKFYEILLLLHWY